MRIKNANPELGRDSCDAHAELNERCLSVQRESEDVPLGLKRLPFNRSLDFVSELESLSALARLPSVDAGTPRMSALLFGPREAAVVSRVAESKLSEGFALRLCRFYSRIDYEEARSQASEVAEGLNGVGK